MPWRSLWATLAGMQMPKPSEQDKEFFRALVPTDPRVEIKPMFGNLGAFVNGNMFMGLFGSDVGVKLADSGREKLLAEPGAGPFGPAERPMGGYVTMPAQWRSSRDAAAAWIEQALEYVGSLPPKKPKSKK
jgi:TfoX/Sxy family transcriptional regulator of competence genes